MNLNDILNKQQEQPNENGSTASGLKFSPINEGIYQIRIADYKIEKRQSPFDNKPEIKIVLDSVVNQVIRIQFLDFLKYSLKEDKYKEFEFKMKQLLSAVKADLTSPIFRTEYKNYFDLAEGLFNHGIFRKMIVDVPFYAAISRKEYTKKDGNTGYKYFIEATGISMADSPEKITAVPVLISKSQTKALDSQLNKNTDLPF